MGRFILGGNLKGSEKKEINVVTDKWRMENISLSKPKTPLSQNQSVRVGIDGIITAINSRGSFSYAITTRWTFQYPCIMHACHGTLDVDLFLTVNCPLCIPTLTLSFHCNKRFPQINKNRRWKGSSPSTQKEFMGDQDSFSGVKPKARQ